MTSLRDLISPERAELPTAPFARWASILFSLSVLTFLLSLAASQAFLAAASVAYVVHLFHDHPPIKFPPVKLPLALFCLTTVLSLAWAANPTVGWFAVRKLVLFLILLLAVNLVVSAGHLVMLYRALFLESALTGLVAAGQFIRQYRAVRALHPGRVYFYMTATRIHGFMGHWMHFGGQQMLMYSALVAFLLLGVRRAKDSRAIWFAIAGIVALSIILNFTRGVWLGCFVATVYLVGRSKSRWLWALPVLVIAGYLAAPGLVRRRVAILRHPASDPALSIRFEMWHAGLRMIERHPWVGVGPDNITEVYPLYLPPGRAPEVGYHEHLHDNFIQFGAERGLPCLGAWIWLMATLVVQAWKIRRRLATDPAGSRLVWLVDGAIAGWLALMVEGCFEFNFGTSPVLMLFLFVAATPYVVELGTMTSDE
ncbi:MAG TPA: O-antigen ligase family protein [Terriglobia bacterium]|nr:O-antigen ligase family protein [Terriglobia bacterium]